MSTCPQRAEITGGQTGEGRRDNADEIHKLRWINQQLCIGLKEIYNDTFCKGQVSLLFTAKLVFITFTLTFTCISLHLLANSIFIYMVPVRAEV